MIIRYTVPEIWRKTDIDQFLVLLSPNYPKNENVKKMKIKKRLEISSFDTSVPKIMIVYYIAPEIWHMADVIVIFHFGLFLPFYPPPPPPPSIPKNENFKTMKKTHADIIILHKCTKNHGHMLHCS